MNIAQIKKKTANVKKAEKGKSTKKLKVTIDTEQTFEEALAELESITEKLESGKVTLDDTVLLYTRGRALHDFCVQKLEDAQLVVNNVMNDSPDRASISDYDQQSLNKIKNRLN